VCGESELVEEEVIADENRRFHRFRRNLRGLRNVTREDKNEDDGEDETFDPFPKGAFAQRTGGVKDCELFDSDIGGVKRDELVQTYIRQGIRSFETFHFGSWSVDHL